MAGLLHINQFKLVGSSRSASVSTYQPYGDAGEAGFLTGAGLFVWVG